MAVRCARVTAEFIPIQRPRQAGAFFGSPPAGRPVVLFGLCYSHRAPVLGCGVNGFSLDDDWALKMLVPFGSLAA